MLILHLFMITSDDSVCYKKITFQVPMSPLDSGVDFSVLILLNRLWSVYI